MNRSCRDTPSAFQAISAVCEEVNTEQGSETPAHQASNSGLITATLTRTKRLFSSVRSIKTKD